MVHKHAEMIQAWLEGEQIQFLNYSLNEWVDINSPNWKSDHIFRIKPKRIEPKQYNDPTEDVEEILDYFDFEKVKKVMDHLNWQWWDTGIPEIPDLRRKARSLLQTVINGIQKTYPNDVTGDYYTATGGFYVTAKVYEGDPKIYLRLSFYVSDFDNYD